MKGFFLYSKLWEETVKKEYVVGILCIVVGVVLFVVFSMYVGKSNKTAPADIQITNTYQLRDISKNEMIRDEARKRVVAMMLKDNLIPDGGIEFVRVMAYNTYGNNHYIAMEFRTKVVGHKQVGHIISYLNVKEYSGQYTVVDESHMITSKPEGEEFVKNYNGLISIVKTCDGLIPVATTEQ